VRRYAIALLTKLILTHPYGLMHGGLLNLEDWDKRYQAVCDELAKLESSELGRQVDTQADDEEGSGEDEDEDEDEDGGAEEPNELRPPATPATARGSKSRYAVRW
jgi:condensin complex subunit 1